MDFPQQSLPFTEHILFQRCQNNDWENMECVFKKTDNMEADVLQMKIKLFFKTLHFWGMNKMKQIPCRILFFKRQKLAVHR